MRLTLLECVVTVLILLFQLIYYAVYTCYFKKPNSFTKELLALDIYNSIYRSVDQYTCWHD